MKLDTYKTKRDFKSTPEPRGRAKSSSSRDGRVFVVQKHGARRLHYDLRLELDGVLKSWAVPKGPSLRPGDRQLAVHTEDHPLEYADFEGVIPAGQYGAGAMIVWDRGDWRPTGDPHDQYRKGKLTFELEGEKLHGQWKLVRMTGKAGENGKNWLLIKSRDDAAAEESDPPVTDTMPASVKSGRTLAELAEQGNGEESSGKKTASKRSNRRVPATRRRAPSDERENPEEESGASSDSASLRIAAERGERGDMPALIAPQLATSSARVPRGDEWVHEIKYDGYRLLARIDRGRVNLWTRSAQDWTARFPGLAEAATALPVEQAWLDGEAVVLDEKGVSSFSALQKALSQKQPGRIAYFVFDLLYLDGHDLRKVPLLVRKKLLRQLMDTAPAPSPPAARSAGKTVNEPVVRFSDHVQGQGEAFFALAKEHALEGVISKPAGALYVSARAKGGNGWLKIKTGMRQEFAIVGFTDPAGSRQGFGALLMADRDDEGHWVYAGKVGTGYDDQTLVDMRRRLEKLRRDTPVDMRNAPGGKLAREAHWVEPTLLAEVQFTGWTHDQLIRHGVFQGLREDKPATEARRDKAAPAPEGRGSAGGRANETPDAPRLGGSHALPDPAARTITGRGKHKVMHVHNVRLTNPDRVLYPKQKVTKADLATYYEHVAEHALPHLADRPLAVVRCPQGNEKECFFQKNIGQGMPDAIDGVEVEMSDGKQTHLCVRDVAGLISLVQMGVLEIHPWNSRADRVDRPDRMIFDLDPGEGVGWPQVIEAAVAVRDALAEVDIRSFVKTSGSKGLHVVAPIERRRDFDDVKAFTKAVAETIARRQPKRYVATMTKSQRRGRIYIDYLRNGYGATAVAAYSTRRKAGAPVSTPVRWDELNDLTSADQYTIANLPGRLAQLKQDPWADYSGVRQSVTKKGMAHFGAA